MTRKRTKFWLSWPNKTLKISDRLRNISIWLAERTIMPHWFLPDVTSFFVGWSVPGVAECSKKNCGGVTCDRLAYRTAEVEILLAASCYTNRDKLRQLWASLGSKASLCFVEILLIQSQFVSLNHFGSRIKHSYRYTHLWRTCLQSISQVFLQLQLVAITNASRNCRKFVYCPRAIRVNHAAEHLCRVAIFLNPFPLESE